MMAHPKAGKSSYQKGNNVGGKQKISSDLPKEIRVAAIHSNH
jgi:hypothetical protein